MKQVPPLPGEEALYAWIGSVVEAAAKDPETKKTLVETAVEAEREIITPLFQSRYNGRSGGNGWTSPWLLNSSILHTRAYDKIARLFRRITFEGTAQSVRFQKGILCSPNVV